MDEKWKDGWIIARIGRRESVCRVETRREKDGYHIRVPNLVEDQRWTGRIYPTKLAALAMLLVALERHVRVVRKQIQDLEGGT